MPRRIVIHPPFQGQAMKKNAHILSALSIAIGLCVGGVNAYAADAPMTTTAGREGDKLADSYATFAGSETNAQALVNGLRDGKTVTLVTPATATSPAIQTTFTPDTTKLGYGNVNIAL